MHKITQDKLINQSTGLVYLYGSSKAGFKQVYVDNYAITFRELSDTVIDNLIIQKTSVHYAQQTYQIKLFNNYSNLQQMQRKVDPTESISMVSKNTHTLYKMQFLCITAEILGSH